MASWAGQLHVLLCYILQNQLIVVPIMQSQPTGTCCRNCSVDNDNDNELCVILVVTNLHRFLWLAPVHVGLQTSSSLGSITMPQC